MKWLATTFLCLLTGTAIAEPQQPNPINPVALPLVMVCMPIDPTPGLEKQYNEIPFIEGDASINIGAGRQVNGKMKMLLSQDMSSFTIMFNLEPDLYCMLMTGENIQPIYRGDPL